MGIRKNHLIEAVLACNTIYVLSKNVKVVKHIQQKFVIFTAVKNRCMLHGRVFVMKLMYKIFCGLNKIKVIRN